MRRQIDRIPVLQIRLGKAIANKLTPKEVVKDLAQEILLALESITPVEYAEYADFQKTIVGAFVFVKECQDKLKLGLASDIKKIEESETFADIPEIGLSDFMKVMQHMKKEDFPGMKDRVIGVLKGEIPLPKDLIKKIIKLSEYDPDVVEVCLS